MTADTFSNTLGFSLMGTGNDNNTWGGIANSQVFQIFEDALANMLTSAVTGGTLDLSGSPPPAAASQVRYAALTFTGVLASNQIIQVPNLGKFWWVRNSCSGAFTLKIKTPAGAASTAIPANSGWQLVHCDGANGVIVEPYNSLQTQMPDGTAGAPAYSFFNETNSGLYRAGANDLRVAINGSDVLAIKSNAIGVGITTPATIGTGQGVAIGSAGNVGTIGVNPIGNAQSTTSAIVAQVLDQAGGTTFGGTGYEYAIVGSIRSTHNTGSLAANKVGVFGGCELSGASCGSGWGGNFCLVALAGSAATCIGTGVEIDVNNASATARNYSNFGSPIYGLQISGSSANTCTAAIILSGALAAPQWYAGMVFNNFRAANGSTWGIDFALDTANSFSGAAIRCQAAVANTYVAQFTNWNAANADQGILIGSGLNRAATAGDTSFLVVFADGRNAFVVGSIGRNATGVVYNTTSDVRLKTNVADINGAYALDRLMQARPRMYARKNSPDHLVPGFVAQELAVAFPYAVTEGGDDPDKSPWMADFSTMMPEVVASVQELSRRVDRLQSIQQGSTA